VSRHLIVRALAEEDLLEAQAWYDEQRPGVGGEFRSTIDGLLNRVLERPPLYPKVYRNVRRAVVRRFPYLLYFVLVGDTVIVMACLHSKRDPALLRSRVP
jgi:plasmid stabilization system protein ParE